MGPILLASDGSEYARKAAEAAIDLADERGVPLHVICIVDERIYDEPALSSAELVTIYAEDHASLNVTEVTHMAEGRDVPIEGVTRHGIPHDSILTYAEEIDADVIVVGEHGDHDEHFSGVGKRLMDESEREVRVVEARG